MFNALDALRKGMNAVIRGKKSVIEWMLLAVLAESSVLLEDVPGVGKTTLAKSFAASVDLQFQRVQCTPDLLPSDILGFNTFQPADGSFAFNPGPIFTNLLLVDEINRASPRTQSALLEAMAERQVTIEGTRHALPSPFLVIATQNPHGFAGTFPLPESQLDRFDGWFQKWGRVVVPVSNALLFTRGMLTVPAGFAEMDDAEFVVLSALGTLVFQTWLAAAALYAVELGFLGFL